MIKRKKIALLTLLVIILSTALIISTHLLTKEKSEVTKTETSQDEEKIPEQVDVPFSKHKVIGQSVEGREIESYTFGNGDTTLLFIGGIHGGYEWNSVLLAYKFIDELEAKKINVPSSLKIEIIPNLNPDGVYKVVGKEGRFIADEITLDTKNGEGRFNSNGIDLNRNFDCKWQPTSTWRNKIVSAGTSAFSEPESQTLKKLVEETKPQAVVFWHSQANAVYASECEKGVLPETLKIMNTYANSADYKAVAKFDAYPVSGDAEGWLASINIPAITVELSSHEGIDWEKNKKGFEAMIGLYDK